MWSRYFELIHSFEIALLAQLIVQYNRILGL